MPYLAGWALIVVLLLVVKENRNRQAWTILVPCLLLTLVIWPMVVRLLSLPSGQIDDWGFTFNSLVVAWTAIWLLIPWLAKRRPAVAFALAAAVVLTIGILGRLHPLWTNYSAFGIRYFDMRLATYSVLVFALMAATVLSAACCRRTYRPRHLLAWLMLWAFVGVFAGFVLQLTWLYGSGTVDWRSRPILPLLPRLTIVSLCVAVILYLANLPFMYVAFRSPCYRDRFHDVLRLPKHEEVVT